VVVKCIIVNGFDHLFLPFLCSKMSWQDYVDKQLLASRCVTKAAIAGHDGNVWAKSEGFEVSSSSKRMYQETGERKRERERKSVHVCVCVCVCVCV